MRTRFYLLLPAFAMATFVFGQNQIYLPWEFAGGPPCPVRDMVLHHGTLYAATDCGLYKRPESGGQWEHQSGTPDSAVLFVAASEGAVVAVFSHYVSNWSSGYYILDIFNSLDDGDSFVRRYDYWYNGWSYPPSPHATNHTDFVRLYALGDSSFALAAHSCDYGCRYVRTASTDNGRHWSPQYLPTQDQNAAYYSILNPYAVQGDTVAVFNLDSLRLAATSTLQGLSATPIPPTLKSQAAGLSWKNDRITVAFQNGRYAYTDDLGQNWTTDSLPLSGINDFFYQDNYYYWCTNSGFYRSADVGPALLETLYTRPGPLGSISHARRSAGGWYLLANAVPLSLPDGAGDAVPVATKGMHSAVGTVDCLPGRLMFQNADGLWWQSPNGSTWSVDENETAYAQRFREYLVSDTFCLAYAISLSGQSRIYRSVDEGATWSLSSFPNGQNVNFLKNRHDGRAYTGQYFTADGGLSWQSINTSALTAALGDTLLTLSGQISFDHGQSWQSLVPPGPTMTYTFHLADHVVYAYPYSWGTTFRSFDFGGTWEALAAGGPNNAISSQRIGQTTWLRSDNSLGIFPDPGQAYFSVTAPFSGIISAFPNEYPHPDFGRIVQKDSTVYAARNGGVWRTPTCYVQHPFPTPPRDTTICQGNFVLFHGDTLRTAGAYQHNIPGQTTICDSIDVLSLQVHLIKTYWYQKICAGDTLLWNGVAYSGSGAFTQQFSTPTSCDSSVTLYLSPYYTSYGTSAPLCADDTIQLHGQAISTPGQYTFHLTSFAGCDSVLTVNVYDAQDTFNFSPTICAGAGYSLFGHTYTQTGEYWFTRIAPTNPCPSIYHIQLTVLPDVAITVDTFVTVGTLLYGTAVYSDTTFTVLVAGPSSCDKILTLVVHTTVGTIDLDAGQEAQAFPNPFRDQLTLRWPAGESAQLRLYDARGQLWRTARLSGPTAIWETSALPAGLYRAEIGFGGRYFAWNLVKMP